MNKDIWVPQLDSPTGQTAYFLPRQPLETQPDASWMIRTGFKKGITGRALDAELFAGPDAAVLKNGFFSSWTSLLAEFREPVVFVGPDRIADLARTKPYLIVPTGGLHDLFGSEFFKAGLAEYARSGGVIICFAQANSADYTALPTPEGQTIEAAGWEQDPGPLFRASSVQTSHPMLAGTRKTTPDIETSGYLITYPRDSRVVLSRADGFPTLIIYPLGHGFVIVSTLFPDFSTEYEQLEPEEKVLVRDLLSWAKATQTLQASGGDRVDLLLDLQGPEQGQATSAKVFVIGPGGEQAGQDLRIPVDLKTGQTSSALVPFTIPSKIKQGVYHIEYILQNAEGQALTGQVESSGTRFSIGRPIVAAPIKRLAQPLPAASSLIDVQARTERNNNIVRLKLDIVRRTNSADDDHSILIRAAAQERSFTLNASKLSASFDFPDPIEGSRIAFTVLDPRGRSLARGTVPVAPLEGNEVFANQASFPAGKPAELRISGLGKGELSLTMPGRTERQMITGSESASFLIPEALPTGVYPLRWKFRALVGANKSGETRVNVDGYRVTVKSVVLDKNDARANYTARFRILSPAVMNAQISIFLRGPDNKVLQNGVKPISLIAGMQEIPFAITSKPESAGIWELQYTLLPKPAEGSRFLNNVPPLSAGHMIFDVGDTAILGLGTTRPVYYEPSGPVEMLALVYGKGGAKTELYLDNKKIGKDKRVLAGSYAYQVPFSPTPGPHTIKAVVTGNKLENVREDRFIYGAQFPDLAVSLATGTTVTAALPMIITVANNSRTAAGPSRVALYEGDPAHGGVLIAGAGVPKLDPGARHEVAITWPLFRKAGVRTLFAISDMDNKIVESNKMNNIVSREITIPALLLGVSSGKQTIVAGESLAFSAVVSNLTTTVQKDLIVRMVIDNPLGKTLLSDTITVPELSPERSKQIDRSLDASALSPGVYRFQAQAGGPAPSISSAITATILPTLLLKGDLAETPELASLCKPFFIHFAVRNAGNVPSTTGAINLEIRSMATGQPVFARQLPLALESRTIPIENVNFPRGAYTLSLKASAINREHGITREFLLAERPLTVTAPIEVKKAASFIRVLVWRGRSGDPVDQALIEQIVKQTFDEQDIFYRTTDTQEEFATQAATGLFNVYVVLENRELFERTDWLRDRIDRGEGLVIIGSGDRTRMTAESFGFKFTESNSAGLLVIPGDSGMGLTGTLPVSGPLLLPQKRGAKPLMTLADTSKPAALMDTSGNGKVIVMPFSLIRSARDTGTSSLYIPLLQAAVRNVAPEENARDTTRGEELQVTASAGQVKTRIVVTLPTGAKTIWTSKEGSGSKNTITFELTAEGETRKLRYLYQAPDAKAIQPRAELYYECKGNYTGLGNIE